MLAIYIPPLGLRLSLKQFIKSNQPCNHADAMKERKDSLLDNLRNKLKESREKRRRGIVQSTVAEANAESSSELSQKKIKSTRIVQIGWMNFDEKKKKYIQMRLNSGGGIRFMHCLKTAKKQDLIKQGMDLFFLMDVFH